MLHCTNCTEKKSFSLLLLLLLLLLLSLSLSCFVACCTQQSRARAIVSQLVQRNDYSSYVGDESTTPTRRRRLSVNVVANWRVSLWLFTVTLNVSLATGRPRTGLVLAPALPLPANSPHAHVQHAPRQHEIGRAHV